MRHDKEGFELIADTLFEVGQQNRFRPFSLAEEQLWRETVNTFVANLRRKNPRFRAARFVEACVRGGE